MIKILVWGQTTKPVEQKRNSKTDPGIQGHLLDDESEGEGWIVSFIENGLSVLKKKRNWTPFSHYIHTHINYRKFFHIYKINYTWSVNPQKTKLGTVDDVREEDFGSI